MLAYSSHLIRMSIDFPCQGCYSFEGSGLGSDSSSSRRIVQTGQPHVRVVRIIGTRSGARVGEM